MSMSQGLDTSEPVKREPVIDVRSVSKWFGNVVAVNDVTLQVFPGITGLLGSQRRGQDHAASFDRWVGPSARMGM